MKTVATLILVAVCLTAVSAQDAELRFEAASVRPSSPPNRLTPRGGPPTVTPDRLTYQRILFRRLLMDAYGVERDQIKGAPDWAIADAIDGGATFDVVANIPSGASKEQVATMLQNLLKDRFKLSVHRDTIQLSGFALVVAKSGSRLTKSAGPVRDSERGQTGARGLVELPVQNDGFPSLFPDRNMGGTFTGGVARLRFRDYQLSDLVQQLAFALGLRIEDKTGLAGPYDFTLEFVAAEDGRGVGSRLTLPLAQGRVAPLSGALPDQSQLDSVSLMSSALEKQLGLKLEAARVTLNTLVIDHVERTPTEN